VRIELVRRGPLGTATLVRQPEVWTCHIGHQLTVNDGPADLKAASRFRGEWETVSALIHVVLAELIDGGMEQVAMRSGENVHREVVSW
jgi:hypothetical protein